ncbi:MAG: cysteine desulfurase family protein [Patescibacteria group bacterium]|jgi:cysteine desulfurase
MKKTVYLDNASTTPVAKEVAKAMQPYLSEHFGNPSSLHAEGFFASKTVEKSRKIIAEILKTQPDTVYFTSGGTEANNLAVFGLSEGFKGKHIISVATEHASVLEPLKKLEKNGYKVSYVPVGKDGLIKVDDLIKLINKETVLISVMYANNEIGIVQPIADIGRAILRYRKENNANFPYLHSDACQASEYLSLDVEKLHVDLMTINSGKIYGPKGVGALYVRRGVELSSQILGGGQEKGLRSGTENVTGIVGFSKALEISSKNINKETVRLNKLSKYFFDKIVKLFSDAKLNGPEIGQNRLANNVNVVFPGYDGEQLVIYLDSFGVQCSTASACSAVTNEPSHVLKAIGLSEKDNKSSVRFSLGRSTSKKDLDYTISCLKSIRDQKYGKN